MNSNSWFRRAAQKASAAAGRPVTFLIAVGIVVVWALLGPVFGYGDTWQLAINTTTTIITFLMVFLIQSTQNRDTAALQIKLDELIRSVEGAHNALLDLEELDDDMIARVKARYEHLATKARAELADGGFDTGRPEVEGGSRAPRRKPHGPRRKRARGDGQA